MQKIALNERSRQLIKNYLIGGAALGGSAALATSLLNYLKTLKDETAAEDSSKDDDTLYINMPQKTANDEKDFSFGNLQAGGLAMTGGVLSTLGTYALIRKLYQNMKQKQLQEQLDEAQQTFLGNAEEEAKQAAVGEANRPMGIGEFLTSVPVSFALLSALAGGALTNMALNKTFPRVKPTADLGPKKVVLRRPKEKEEDEEVLPEQEKMSHVTEDEFHDGLELIVGLAMNSKSASNSELKDIVHAVAQGRREEFTTNLLEYGFDTAINLVKGAGDRELDLVSRQLAIGACVKSAALNPVISLLAAAEYNDMAPRFTKQAELLSDHNKVTLVKIASVLGKMNRAEVLVGVEDMIADSSDTKSASQHIDIATILDIINGMKQQAPEGDGHFMEDMEENDDITGEDSISSNEEKEVNDLHPTRTKHDAPEIIDELNDDDDAIDAAMSHPIDAAKSVAVESK